MPKFRLSVTVTTPQYHFIEADSEERAKEMWEDGTWEDHEYDRDECIEHEVLDKVDKLEDE